MLYCYVNVSCMCLNPQVRDLEQQLSQSAQGKQPWTLSVEEELLGVGLLQKTSLKNRNLSYIRTMEKEKREALEVGVTPRSFYSDLNTRCA